MSSELSYAPSAASRALSRGIAHLEHELQRPEPHLYTTPNTLYHVRRTQLNDLAYSQLQIKDTNPQPCPPTPTPSPPPPT